MNEGKAQIIMILLLLAIIVGYMFIAGNASLHPQMSQTGVTAQLACCNSGDGASCKPQTGSGQTINFNGKTYGLLRSQVMFTEGNLHLKDSGQKTGNDPIIENSSDIDNNVNAETTAGYNQYCRRNTDDDTYFKKFPTDQDRNLLKQGAITVADFARIVQKYCTPVPNDELIFVCRQNCHPATCLPQFVGSHCYGDEKTVYDVYGRIDQRVPDFIAYCDKSNFFSSQNNTTPQVTQQVVLPTEKKRENLHLNTFSIREVSPETTVPWLSPFCKPAVYLYPQEKTNIRVSIHPQGKLTLTIPEYPINGWNVTAYPDGQIENINSPASRVLLSSWPRPGSVFAQTKGLLLTPVDSGQATFMQTERSQARMTKIHKSAGGSDNNHFYDYLYYEAEIPNDSYQKPDKGFIIKQTNLDSFLRDLLSRLGLNEKEKQQFLEYWLSVLPKSNYYFVGIIPQETLNQISPLSIFPIPTQLIRVTLYFEALDQPISVTEPTITTPARSGFTVVEWGGIFKRDKNHPFSCFM